VSLGLVPGLLLGRRQRPVGRVRVHPSAPIQWKTHHKLLKINKLAVFQNGAFCLLLETGNALAEMGTLWANWPGAPTLVCGTVIALTASNLEGNEQAVLSSVGRRLGTR